MGVGRGRTHKKLTAAARYWSGADRQTAPAITIDASLEEGLLFFGMSQADIDAQREQEAAATPLESLDCEVHQDCWDPVQFYLRVQTQWVYVSGGLGAMRLGLNYTAVESTMGMCGVKRRDQMALLDDLRCMERAVLDVDAERAEAAAEKADRN